jgi:methylthioribose-1-phosphate isomerase
VGADRIASNGDVANKIGTYSLAVLAQQHRVKLMVVAPMSTIDWHIKDGSEIIIEQRHQDEIIPPNLKIGNAKVDAWNPVFDVTPVELITAIVTDRGVVINPAQTGIKSLKNE